MSTLLKTTPLQPGRKPTTPDNPARLMRKAAGLTQEKFAALLDVSAATVRKWERGSPMPRHRIQTARARLGIGL